MPYIYIYMQEPIYSHHLIYMYLYVYMYICLQEIKYSMYVCGKGGWCVDPLIYSLKDRRGTRILFDLYSHK